MWTKLIKSSINLETQTQVYPTQGSLVYEYNPLRNFRLSKNMYLYKGDYYSLEELKDKLSHFKGARRRFDVLLDDGVQIIDDYAHHPTEILATVKAAKERCTTKLIAIFT